MAITSPEVIPKISVKQPIKSSTLRWATTMPFGVPVEPEVKFTYSGSVSTAPRRISESRAGSSDSSARAPAVTMGYPGKISRAAASSSELVTMTPGASTETIWPSRCGGSSGFREE